MQCKSGTDTIEKRECRWKLGLQIYSQNNMRTNTLQVLAIALCFSGGFSLNSLLNGPPKIVPTIRINPIFYSVRSILIVITIMIGGCFSEENIPQDMHLL